MPDEVHLNDIGTIFRVTIVESSVAVDVSSVTAKTLIFQKPDPTTSVTQSATFTGVGTDGQIEYKTLSGDTNRVGTWKLQAHLVFLNGDDLRSQVGQFFVHPNL